MSMQLTLLCRQSQPLYVLKLLAVVDMLLLLLCLPALGMGQLNLSLLFAVFMTSAVLGDAVNYAIGNKLGRWTLAQSAPHAASVSSGHSGSAVCIQLRVSHFADTSACACGNAMCGVYSQ
jgi:hypothetical protein